jgi:hypothetical protein
LSATGTIGLNTNNTAFQVKDSSGTLRTAFLMNASDIFTIGTTNNVVRVNSFDVELNAQTGRTVAAMVNSSTIGSFSSTGLAVTGTGTFTTAPNSGIDIYSNPSTNSAKQTTLRLWGHEGSAGRYVEIACVNGAGANINNLALSTGYAGTVTERLRIDAATGNVGIGTTSPDTTLDVEAANASFRVYGTGATDTPQFQLRNGSQIWQQIVDGADSNKWKLKTGGGLTALTCDTSGNFGIGTASPAEKLDVAGNIKIGKSGDSSVGGGYQSVSSFTKKYYGSYWNSVVGPTEAQVGAIYGITTASNVNPSPVTRLTLQAAAAGGAMTDVLSVLGSGNVGIGTTSPSQLLTFGNATAGLGIGWGDTSGNYANIFAPYSASGLVLAAGFQGNRSSDAYTSSYGGGAMYRSGIRLNAFGNGNIQFFTDGSSTIANGSAFTPTERMRIDSSGNLRIGVTGVAYNTERLTVYKSGNVESAAFVNDAGANNYTVAISNRATTGDNKFVVFATESSDTTRGSIAYNRGSGVVVYATTSDYRSKDILGPVIDSGALIDSVPVYMGKIKGATLERPMFIAHETPAYAHTGEKDAVDAEGKPIYQQMDASTLVPVLWAELQSLRARVAALENN